MKKPTVHYYKQLSNNIKLGSRALIHPIDHPDSEHVSNQTWVLTSKVIWHDSESGNFETLNTMYVPKE